MFKVPEASRVRKGNLSSSAADGKNGAFMVKAVEVVKNELGKPEQVPYFLLCIASDAQGWEHLSVLAISPITGHRQPNFTEMCMVRHLFWGKEDTVVQIHPPEDKYKNAHPLVLHLWRKPGFEMPVPPADIAGFEKKSIIQMAKDIILP